MTSCEVKKETRILFHPIRLRARLIIGNRVSLAEQFIYPFSLTNDNVGVMMIRPLCVCVSTPRGELRNLDITHAYSLARTHICVYIYIRTLAIDACYICYSPELVLGRARSFLRVNIRVDDYRRRIPFCSYPLACHTGTK